MNLVLNDLNRRAHSVLSPHLFAERHTSSSDASVRNGCSDCVCQGTRGQVFLRHGSGSYTQFLHTPTPIGLVAKERTHYRRLTGE